MHNKYAPFLFSVNYYVIDTKPLLLPPQVDTRASTAAQGQMSIAMYTVPTSGPVLGCLVSDAQQENVDDQDTPLREDTMEYLIRVHVKCYCALSDLDKTTSERFIQQAIHDVKIHCARDALVPHYEDNPADVDTTLIQQQRAPFVSLSLQAQHHRGSGLNIMIPHVQHPQQQQTGTPPVVNTTPRLMQIKGRVAASW